jgi:DNA polymerase elongation subunit (family B)
VTSYGRKQILFAKDVIERFYGPQAGDPRCSAEITYGDTDSLFVNFNVKNSETGEPLKGNEAIQATMDLTEEAGKFVTRALKSPHDFEYDKVFYPFIIFSKKRYVGNKYEGSLDYYSQTSMGIATKRRDYASLVKVIYGGALRILLTEKDIPKALLFIADKLKELVSGTMSLNLLTMSKSLRAEYKTPSPPAHKVLAERIKARDPGNAPASGERVQFVYVTPTPGQQAAKLQGDRVETPSYIRAKGLKPDYRFYIEHQLMNPIVQLFSLVADKIPGVVAPSVGWAKATESDKEIATNNAVFGQILAHCDKLSVRAFGESFFGTASLTHTTVSTTVRRPTTGTAAKLSGKVQPKLGYFIDKMIVEKMDAEKKKRAKKTPNE